MKLEKLGCSDVGAINNSDQAQKLQSREKLESFIQSPAEIGFRDRGGESYYKSVLANSKAWCLRLSYAGVGSKRFVLQKPIRTEIVDSSRTVIVTETSEVLTNIKTLQDLCSKYTEKILSSSLNGKVMLLLVVLHQSLTSGSHLFHAVEKIHASSMRIFG